MEEIKENASLTGNKTQKRLNISIPLNFWMFSTIILAIVVIILLIFIFKGGISGNVVSSVNTNTAVNTPAVKASATAASTQNSNITYTKSDKPLVEAFVFSYCPFGVQFEKALSPVYDLLKDKSEINIVFIGAMHGEYEKVESFRQVCIQKLYSKDKLWDYLNEFIVNADIGKCKGKEDCVNPLIEKIYSNNGIDKSKIENCMAKDAEKIYNENMARAKELSISGSPTFVVNNVKIKVARSAEAMKEAICSSFNKDPSACDTKLSNTAASSGFGAGTGTASSASC